jgi:hypothetical protein
MTPLGVCIGLQAEEPRTKCPEEVAANTAAIIKRKRVIKVKLTIIFFLKLNFSFKHFPFFEEKSRWENNIKNAQNVSHHAITPNKKYKLQEYKITPTTSYPPTPSSISSTNRFSAFLV